MKPISIKFNAFYLLLLGLAFVACSSDKDDFEGTDNYIFSFVLQKGEESYPVAIQKEQLLLTVPAHTDLTQGVTAHLSMAELATIQPDPKEVSDWSKSIEFVVTAYNQAKRTYIYQVSYDEAITHQSVKLTNQKEVDEFGAQGIKEIQGNLIIGQDGQVDEKEIIHNLDGLSQLQVVGQNITIRNSFQGENLDGLSQLKVAGNLYLGDKSNPYSSEKLTVFELPSLQKVSELVIHSAQLKTIQLPQLQTVFSLDLIGQQLEEVELPQLQTITNSFVCKASTERNTKNETLRLLHLPKLQQVGSQLLINKITQIETVQLPSLKTIGASLLIDEAKELTTLELKQLQRIGGTLTLKEVKQLTHFELPELMQAGAINVDAGYNTGQLNHFSLAKLQKVDGEFYIKTLSELTTLELPELTAVGEMWTLNGFNQLTTILAPKLQTCGAICYHDLNALTAINYDQATVGKLETITCNQLTEVKVAQVKEVTFNGGSAPAEVPHLVGIEEIEGMLDITNYTQTETFSFPNLKKIGHLNFKTGISNGKSTLSCPDLIEVGKLAVSGSSLHAFDFPKLEKVTEKWETNYFKFMENEDIVIPQLKEVKEFHFKGAGWEGDGKNMPLTNLDIFQNLQKVEKVVIENWGHLIDYTGLKQIIKGMDAKNWIVKGNKYNPTFEQMEKGEYIQP